MRALAVALCLALVAACTPKRPPKPPEPPPPPVKEAKFLNLLVRQEAGGTLMKGGQPWKPFGFVPCWDGEEVDHMGWPGIDDAGMDYALQYGADAFHIRLGPFTRDDKWPNGLNAGSSAYIDDDPAKGFNPAWWAKVRRIVERAGQRGAVVEVDLIDGWQCRHATPKGDPGSVPHPWSAADLNACANTLTPTHRDWLRKIVDEVGCFGNVIWQDGNEIGINASYKPAWSFAIRDVIREAEQELGCGVVHLFGTNSGHADVESDPRIDYTVTHQRAGVSGPYYGKHRMNNERNPPFLPDQEHALWCAARENGAATWWYWRGGTHKDEMSDTLALWQKGCEGMGGGDCPFEVPVPTVIRVKPHGTDYYDATPLVQNFTYCRSIDSDRSLCPVRPEGDPFREPCEQSAMGSQIQWWLTDVEGDLGIKVSHRGYGVTVTGRGKARLRCTFATANGEDKCSNAQGGELWVSR
jgi:hypothetical protein